MASTRNQHIEDKVLGLIGKKLESSKVFIVDKNSKNPYKIVFKNKYETEVIYAKFQTRDELNHFISGYYACWSDSQ